MWETRNLSWNPQILVHGEQNEMARLKAALIREYEDNDQVHIEVHNPRNTEAVTLNFRGEKLAKVCWNNEHVFFKFYKCKNPDANCICTAFIPFICSMTDLCALPFFQVMGSLADNKCIQGQRVSGILVKKNFNYHILNPSDLSSEFESVREAFIRIRIALFYSTQRVAHQSVNLAVLILCPQHTQSWPWAQWNSLRSSPSRGRTRSSCAI